MLSPLGRPQTTILALGGAVGVGVSLFLHWWIPAGVVAIIAVGGLAFFRDPQRRTPTMRGQIVSPADGRISSIHKLEHYEPLGGPAVCIRVFLSVLDVHVNRSPVHGRVVSITHKDGQHLNALKAESAELNESVTIVLEHPSHHDIVAVVRQVAGAIARRIVCATKPGEILQRGERFGLIKFGSTTEVYLPHPDRVTVQARQGQYVWGGETVLATATSPRDAAEPAVPRAAQSPSTAN